MTGFNSKLKPQKTRLTILIGNKRKKGLCKTINFVVGCFWPQGRELKTKRDGNQTLEFQENQTPKLISS